VNLGRSICLATVASLPISILRFLRKIVKRFETPIEQVLCVLCDGFLATEGGELDNENDLSFDCLHTIEMIFRRIGNMLSVAGWLTFPGPAERLRELPFYLQSFLCLYIDLR
jgi:hypothetical protein